MIPLSRFYHRTARHQSSVHPYYSEPLRSAIVPFLEYFLPRTIRLRNSSPLQFFLSVIIICFSLIMRSSGMVVPLGFSTHARLPIKVKKNVFIPIPFITVIMKKEYNYTIIFLIIKLM